MAYLAVDDPLSLTANDHARLGLVLPPGDPAAAPYAAVFLQDFDQRYCYDRFHDRVRTDDWIDTRIMCCGHAFVIVGDARQPAFTDLERGILAQFRNSLFSAGPDRAHASRRTAHAFGPARAHDRPARHRAPPERR